VERDGLGADHLDDLLRLMDATPVPCGASAVTARRSGLYGYRGVPGWKSTPTPT